SSPGLACTVILPMRCFAISFSMPGYWALATVANARKAIVVRETGEFMAAGFGTIVGKFLTGSNHFYTAARRVSNWLSVREVKDWFDFHEIFSNLSIPNTVNNP